MATCGTIPSITTAFVASTRNSYYTSPCNGPETSDVVVFTINNGIGQAAYCAILTNSDAPNAHADHDLPRPNGSADMGYPQGNNI